MTQATRPPAMTTSPPRPNAGAGGPNMTLLLISLGLGLLAVVAHIWHVENVRKSATEQTETVFQVRKTLEPGDKVEAKDLRAVPIPVRFLDTFPGAITMRDRDELAVGQRVQRYVAENAILTSKDFLGLASSDELDIGKGKRLAVLPVSSDSTTPLLEPEMRVDISVAVTPRGGTLTVMPVMEGVRVVGVGARSKLSGDTRRSRSYSDVTIEVSPEERDTLNTIKRFLPDEDFIISIRSSIDPGRSIIGGGINPEVLKALGIKQD